jgi:hypothetical protein
MAPRMPSVVGIVTIGGNLDTDAWTDLHGYSRLSGSLNPSQQPALRPGLQEWHLIGVRDSNVPYSASQTYFERIPPERVIRYAGFDHVCCWVREWPSILDSIVLELESRTLPADQARVDEK